jgi:hypothetical protein
VGAGTRRSTAGPAAAPARAAAPGTTGALGALLNGAPRVQTQLRLRDTLNPPRPLAAERPAGTLQRAAAAPTRGVAQRVMYGNMNAMLAAVAGGAAPVLANFDPELQRLFTEAEGELPDTDVVAVPGLGRVAEIGAHPMAGAGGPMYQLNYNPGAPDQQFLIASMLHELVHASTDRHYRKTVPGVPTPFWNLNLPAGTTAATVGGELNAQIATLDQNLAAADAIAGADHTLGVPMRTHVRDRLQNYAMIDPDVHYDTVLADIMAYMELNGVNAGPTFDYVRRLVRESTDRRVVDPWWGTKRAREVDPNAGWYEFWKW